VENEGCLCYAGKIIPKDILNKDYILALKQVADGEAVIKPYVEPPEDPKHKRDRLLNEMNYDFGDGRVIQTRPQDEQNIRNAIDIMQKYSYPVCHWIMLDNVKYEVTVEELQTALKEGQKQAMKIWNEYNP
jgi:hypothetical protein